MAEITQVISTIPQAGKRGIQERDDFVVSQESFQDHLVDNTVEELNTFKDQTNTLRIEVNNTRDTIVEKEALVSPHYTTIDTVSNNIDNITTVNQNINTIENVNNNIDNITTVNNNIDDIIVTSNNITDVNTVGSNIANVNNVGSNIIAINTTSSNTDNIVVVSNNINNINSVGDNIDDVLNAESNANRAETASNIATGAVNYKGDWNVSFNSGLGYDLGMSVSYTDGYNYISKVDNNITEPTSETNTTEWDYIEAVSPATLETELAKKQNVLISGDNIKTVNGISVVGGGDINVKLTQAYLMAYSI